MAEILFLISGFACVAFLYASVGHGGASGYLAVMTLAGIAPAVMKPCALSLNVAVSLIGTFAFAKAGHFRWRVFWPFCITSIPAAWIGGAAPVQDSWFRFLLGCVLIFAAWRIGFPRPAHEGGCPERVSTAAALLSGIPLGLVSGWMGVGGGIFLTPLLILLGWAPPKQAAAVSAPFIFVNSIAGLAGWSGGAESGTYPAMLTLAALPGVLIGGWAGARMGSGPLPVKHLRSLLGIVLLVAAMKTFL